MEIKILQVFLGADGLPYKDQERTVHFPIVGSGFQGASNTTKIRFYYDELVEQDDTETAWVACAKLPNGKIGSKVLETDYDSTLGEHYALLELDSFYFQYKGDVYISLQGYQGGVQVDYDEETELYTIYGTPTIAATGSIKLSVNYAAQFVGSGETSNVNFQRILADLGTKLGIRATSIFVEELPTVGNPDTFYVIHNDLSDPNKANIYIWNSVTEHYIWVGDNTLDLGNYYTQEQGEQFESDIDNRVDAIETQVQQVASGSPKGVYATLAALQEAYPTGTTGIYVVQADGHWYYWNGTAWADGGVYQTDLSYDSVKREIDNLEATLANTSFVKGGNNIFFGNPSLTNLYVSSASSTASFTLATDVLIPANTKINFRVSGIYCDIPGYSSHQWYLAIYNSSNTNVQNVIKTDDEFDFISNSTAYKMTILLQITYSISESGRYMAQAFCLEMWNGSYEIDTDMLKIIPAQNDILPSIVGQKNTNQYNGKVVVCGDTNGRQYFSSSSTSVNVQLFEATGLTAGDKIHFSYSEMLLDISPTTVSYGTIFMAKFNAGGTNLGYAYFTPDMYYTVEPNVVRVIAYMTVNYTIATSSWGILTVKDCLVTVGDITINESLSKIASINTITRERVRPNDTYSAGGNIKRCYNPYKNKGSYVLTGQLHCHSKFLQNDEFVYYAGSDEGLLELMHNCGYDFATITDYFHNGEITQKPANTHGIIWLCNGQEVAPSANSGLTAQHMCVYNCSKVYNFPANSQPEYIAKIITEDGCSCDLAHPSWSNLYQSPEKIALIKNKVRFCEIYDGLNAIDNAVTFPEGKSYDYAWEIMLDNGCVTWGTAVNDSHTGSDANGGISKGCVKVYTDEQNAPSIWSALCKGTFVASTNVSAMIDDISFVDGTLTIVTGDNSASVVFKKEEGTVVKTATGNSVSYTFDGTEKYVRAVVTLSNGEIIWCQPIINVSFFDIDDYNYTY